MKYLLCIAIVLPMLAGCSKEPYKGNGEYFELSNRHVIYRDLTRPFGMDNTGEVVEKINTPGALPQ